ncbi:MAG: hypothetical protein CM1200mP28_12670 [Deltaproteobacteria bacterium]|nr:MAG: hypothetical protein CM1200mP28_12670 [Deltaproteobacteria bacterium]
MGWNSTAHTRETSLFPLFPVNGVIRGWTEALQLMKEGDKWELIIPPDLAYGRKGQEI